MEIIPVKSNNGNIYAVLEMPNNKANNPLVIFSHGYGRNADDFSYQAQKLCDIGIASIRFDFCGGSPYSRSDLSTTRMTLFTEVGDLLAVIKKAKSLPHIDSEKIFLYGESQGGLVSALAAAQNAGQIRALFLIYPALCIADDWRSKYKDMTDIPDELDFWEVRLGRQYFETAIKLDVYKEITKYDGKVLIVHGDNDSIVPVAYSKKASELYSDAQLLILPNEEHGFTKEGIDTTLEYVINNGINNSHY